MLEGLSPEALTQIDSPVGKTPHERALELADTDPEIFIPDAVEASDRDGDGSLHVVMAGSMRCPECGRLHTGEWSICSDACEETRARRLAGVL
jgi:hypothetical protein